MRRRAPGAQARRQRVCVPDVAEESARKVTRSPVMRLVMVWGVERDDPGVWDGGMDLGWHGRGVRGELAAGGWETRWRNE